MRPSQIIGGNAGCWTAFAAEDAVHVTDVMGGKVREQRDADPAAGVSGAAPDLAGMNAFWC